MKFCETRRDAFSCCLLFVIAFLFFFVLTPSVGITDVDAFSYIEGARSLRQGLGYVDTSGNALNHWPPGYSLLLSQFVNPLRAAYWINALSFASATSALFMLALQFSWPVAVAFGFATAFGAGFFYSLAAPAKPDMLTYAVFLIAILFILKDRTVQRTIGLILLSVLIPFKSIAVVFYPALIVLHYYNLTPPKRVERRPEYIVAGPVWAGAIIAILAFNFHTIGAITPSSYEPFSLNALMVETWRFVYDFFRAFLSNWYGSVRPLTHFITFMAVLFAGICALGTLRFGAPGRNARHMGISLLAFSWLLEFVRVFYAGPRLMGYGLLLILLGGAPKAKAKLVWATYSVACIIATVLNTLLVETSGAGHLRYAEMAHNIERFIDVTKPLYTNSLGLIDVHIGKRSIPVYELPGSSGSVCFLHVVLPNYDAVGAKVWPIATPNDAWTLIAAIDGAKLYCRS